MFRQFARFEAELSRTDGNHQRNEQRIQEEEAASDMEFG
jgi:hypothetical protein